MRGVRALMVLGLCALGCGGVVALVQAAPGAEGSGGLIAASALIAAYNGSGHALFRAFAEKPGNIVFSPYSIGTTMTMALAGARGENEAEMAKVLHLRIPREEIDSANAAVQANFDSIASASVQLRVANAVMLTRSDGAVSADYLAVLRRDFAAELLRGADLETVNAWVQKKTNGKIDSILDRLDPATLLVLIDAVYFKARWDRAFDVKVTDHQIFHLPAGTAEVPMMHAHDNFALAERPGYRAIRLPYAGKRLAMIVVLPDAGMADVVRLLDDGEMRLLRAALHASNHSVDLSLPRFRAGFKASLVGPFAAMGMHRAFDPRTADFSGMTGKPQSQLPLTIGEIMHRAVIEVAEEGTEAAAATSATMAIAGRPAPPETFRVDRPFLFAIVDEETGAVLFQGRIVDPRQSS